jgi:hypothetical protein
VAMADTLKGGYCIMCYKLAEKYLKINPNKIMVRERNGYYYKEIDPVYSLGF